MQYKYDKDIIKESLTIEQIFGLVEELGGEPRMANGYFVAKTICHNNIGEGSYKLYYYDNTKLFKCYTECNDTFDIFELIVKVHENYTLYNAIAFVATYFGFAVSSSLIENEINLQDWKTLQHYEKNKEIDISQPIIEFKKYNRNILYNLPLPHIPWEDEDISIDVLLNNYIRYDGGNQSIVIPHFDKDGALIGIRERTLIEEDEQYGKYKPAIFNNQMYNHPLGFNLYNLNNSKKNIEMSKTVITFEGEKSCLKYASMFGINNDISVATCGSSLIKHQFDLLMSLGVTEIVIAFDKQFQKIGDNEFKKWTKKLCDIREKYRPYCLITFMFDKFNLLDYKDSPIDKGKDVFLKLFKERIVI